MGDNLSDRDPKNDIPINMDQELEVIYWTRDFDCSMEDLHEAVEKVGNSSFAVREYLNDKKG